MPVTVAHHNRVVRAGTKRALALEPRLVKILVPILDRAAREAASAFEQKATGFLTAAAYARADERLLLTLAPRDARSLVASLVLTASTRPNSTMIALKPRPEEASVLAQDGGHEPDDLHVTLALLGAYDGDLDALALVLAPVAAGHAPLEGKVAGFGAFEGKGGSPPSIYLPSVPGLVELRVAVTEALADAGHRYNREYGYVPHMTTDYGDTLPSRDGLGAPLHFDELLIVRGNAEVVALPFVGPPPLTAAAGTEQTLLDAMNGVDEATRRLASAVHDGDQREVQAARVALDAAKRRLERELAAKSEKKAKQAKKEPEPPEVNVPAGPPTAPSASEAPPGRAAEVGREVAKRGGEDARIEEQVASEIEALAHTHEGKSLRRISEELVKPFSGAPDWVGPLADEIVNVALLVDSLRTKTDPVRQAVIENVMKSSVEGAGIDFDLTNPFAAKVLAQSGSQITNIAETTQLNAMKIIGASYDQGLSIPDTAKAIRVGMKEASLARATLIARTELAGAVNGGSLAATQIVQSALGETYYKQWLTAPGAPNPRHEDYDGLDEQTQQLDDYFDVGGVQLQYPGDPDGPPEEVCNCFVGSTSVVAPGLQMGFRRRYEGNLVRVEVVGVDVLSGTPNHPVLTSAGWKPLGLLREGDYLVCALPGKDEGAVDPDVDHTPAAIEQVFRALTSGEVPRRIRGRAVQFHGDASVDGEVEVVTADGYLGDGLDSAIREESGEFEFARTREATASLAPTGLGGDLLLGDGSAASGLLRGGGKLPALGGARLSHPDAHRLGTSAGSQTDVSESAVDDATGDAVALGERLYGRAFDVALAKVVRVERVAFHGEVFNLQTETGTYLANGIVAHNCRCALVYVSAEDAAAQGVELGGDSQAPEPMQPPEIARPLMTEPQVEPPTIETADPTVAARAIWNGQKVVLSQPTEIATLIDDLGAMAKDAQTKGLAAPPLDLGKVTVPGTNLFTQESIGVPRVEMPQLKGVPTSGTLADAMARDKRGEVDIAPLFYKHLQDEGVKIEKNQSVRVDQLRATQTELDGAKVAGIMDYLEGGGTIEGTIPVTKDGYVIDGHHRWAAEIGLDYKSNADKPWMIAADVVDKDVTSIISDANIFAAEYGLPQSSAFVQGLAQKAETQIGITPFRVGDQAVNFYETAKAKQFEAELEPVAKQYGVTVSRNEKVTGVWQGAQEPSYAVSAHDGPDGVARFAATMRAKYDQDGVLLFHPDPAGDSYSYTLHRVNPDEVVPKLGDYGIEGATAAADTVTVIGDQALADNVARLADSIKSVVTVKRGALSFVERGDVARSVPEINALHPAVEMALSEHDQGVVVSMIRVPVDTQGKGAASAAMTDVLRYADQNGLAVALTPEALPGGMSTTQLRAWYKRLGFVPNKGRTIDLRFTESMIRKPDLAMALPDWDPYNVFVNGLLDQADSLIAEAKREGAPADAIASMEQQKLDLLGLRDHPDPKAELSAARTEQLGLAAKVDDGTATAVEKARYSKLDDEIEMLTRLRNSDAYAALAQARQVAADEAKQKEIAARQEKTLREAVAKGEQLKADQIASVYAMRAALADKADDEFVPIPARTIPWSENGSYQAGPGAAWRHGDVIFTAEMPSPMFYPTAPTTATVGTLQKKIEPWVDALPPEIRGRLDRVNIFVGVDPDEAYWAAQYGQGGGGHILASTGQGQMSFWSTLTQPDALTQGTLEHESGHLMFLGGGAKDPEAWMDAANKDADTARSTFLLNHGEALEGTTPGSFRGFLVGVRGVSDYGVSDAAEDWAESVRLYLRDRREGSIGTLEAKLLPAHLAPAREVIAPRPVRFAEVYPNRAKLIEKWLGFPPEPAKVSP